ncbi:SWIM zinc finger family protein [Frigoriglobus tundricola]|uniref:SWIM zinc finger family protein n=1 Tax=Frigoriglobus tundricola TaxID=2774151 RepID=UPI001D088BDD|nr:SWIM zinc finger family protein [Frigoriglobus tundricola]
MNLTARLSSQVPATVRDRGQEDYRSGSVFLDEINSRQVLATVEGTETCEVDLNLDGRTIYAYCTCPTVSNHGTLCRHIWATVLAADTRKFANGVSGPLRLVLEDTGDVDDDYVDPSPFRFPVAPPTAPPARSPSNDWKNQLAALSREVQPPAPVTDPRRTAERQLLYVADAPASDIAKKLVLEVNIQERKKNGEWGKPKAQSLSPAQIEALTDPADRQLLSLLGGAERGDNYGYYNNYSSYGYGYGVLRYRLAGLLLDSVLPLLAASGRVKLQRNPHPPVVLEDAVPDLDPPWQLSVGVTHDAAKKKWVLAGGLKRGDRTMALTEPALIVPGLVFWDGRFSRLDDAGAFPWVPILRRAGTIAVPVNKSQEFLGQLLQMPRLPKLDLPAELHYTEETVPPRPLLKIKAPKHRYGDAVLNTDLSFDYAGQVIPAGAAGRGVFLADDKRFVVRPRRGSRRRAAPEPPRRARAGPRAASGSRSSRPCSRGSCASCPPPAGEWRRRASCTATSATSNWTCTARTTGSTSRRPPTSTATRCRSRGCSRR